ncbi:MAG: hypothetical protein ABIR63_03320 [Sphingomicrobium sp.]
MPRPDPIRGAPLPIRRRFWRIFRLLSLFALLVAAIAVILVSRGEKDLHIHMLIATALGAGLVVMVGAALMSLVFLSASSGHDSEAARRTDTGRNDTEGD